MYVNKGSAVHTFNDELKNPWDLHAPINYLKRHRDYMTDRDDDMEHREKEIKLRTLPEGMTLDSFFGSFFWNWILDAPIIRGTWTILGF